MTLIKPQQHASSLVRDMKESEREREREREGFKSALFKQVKSIALHEQGVNHNFKILSNFKKSLKVST